MANYTAQTITLVSVLLICSAFATSFSCGDLETAACKMKFAKQFGDDFKNLHLTALRKLFTTIVDLANTIKAELPKEDPLVPMLEELSIKVSKDLESLNENTDDNEKISKIIAMKALKEMSYNASEKNINSDDFKKLLEKYNARTSFVSIINQLAIDMGTLWANTYAGLRPEDLKAYPSYATVNELMENLRKLDACSSKIADYGNAALILGDEFNILYFKYITGIV